jgi:hypothetical protein
VTGIFIQDEDGTAEIVANGYYGADFKVDIFDQDLNVYLGQNLAMTELQEPITSFSDVTIGNQVQGDVNIALSSVTGLFVSDRIKIGNYIYKVISIIGNNITIEKALKENISAGGNVSKQGNLGIYKISLNIGDIGTYTLIGKDSIFGLTVSKMIKVVPKSLETMYKDIKNLELAILGS